MTNPTQPTDAQIAAVLDELAIDASGALEVTDRRDNEERTFWRSQASAFNKALAHFLAGVRLTRTPSGGWLCPSASEPGAVIHRLWAAGDIWLCSCPASRFCWHAALHTGYQVAMSRVVHADAVRDAAPVEEEDLLPFVPSDEEVARERALAAIYAEVDDWYMAA